MLPLVWLPVDHELVEAVLIGDRGVAAPGGGRTAGLPGVVKVRLVLFTQAPVAGFHVRRNGRRRAAHRCRRRLQTSHLR